MYNFSNFSVLRATSVPRLHADPKAPNIQIFEQSRIMFKIESKIKIKKKIPLLTCPSSVHYNRRSVDLRGRVRAKKQHRFCQVLHFDENSRRHLFGNEQFLLLFERFSRRLGARGNLVLNQRRPNPARTNRSASNTVSWSNLECNSLLKIH
jgi:hypothetical protein